MLRFNRWHFRFLSTAALVLTSWSTSGEAAPAKVPSVPSGITQQGRVLDADGNPVTSEVAMTFTIYDDPTAAAPANVLFTQVLNIQLDDGYFSGRIGEDGDNPFPPTLFDGSVRYLGITVGADDELAPRARLASVPYAFLSNDAIGDIHPASVTVAGKEVIDNKGNWVGAPADRQFSTLLSITQGAAVVTVALGNDRGIATCPANSYLTGGGCTAASSDTDGDGAYTAALKECYPKIAAGAPAPNQWICGCYSSTDQCTVTPYAVCVKN